MAVPPRSGDRPDAIPLDVPVPSGGVALQACPYLGMAKDHATRYTFADPRHDCSRWGTPFRVSVDHQRAYCLTQGHQDCPHAELRPQELGPQRGSNYVLLRRARHRTNPLPGRVDNGSLSSGTQRRRKRSIFAVLHLRDSWQFLCQVLGAGVRGIDIRKRRAILVTFAAVVLAVAALFLRQAPGDPGSDPGRPQGEAIVVAAATAVQTPPLPSSVATWTAPVQLSASAPTVQVTPRATATARSAEPTATATARPVATPSAAITSYTVKAGDTLWSISRSYGITVQELTRANGLTDQNRILVGQKLAIPR